MLSRPIPLWVMVGGFTLCAIAGGVNAIGFLGVHHQALAHMSGPLTMFSNELANYDLALAAKTFAVIGSFFTGCVMSAAIIRQGHLQLGQRYGVVLLLESLCLVGAWWQLSRGRVSGEYLAALACGLQNAMASSYSGAVIRTTHMTGILTDLGMTVGHFLRRQSIDRRRAGLYLVLLAGFLVGGICGSYSYLRLGFGALLIPGILTGVVGAIYTVHEFWRSKPIGLAH